MLEQKSSVYFLCLILVVYSFAEDKDKNKLQNNNEISEDDDTENRADIGPHSAITIVEAPDLSKEGPLGESKEDDDGITNIINEKTLSAFEMLSAIPGEAWVQKFLSQVETDSDYNSEDLDEIDLDIEENEESQVELTAQEIEGLI